MPDLDTIRRCQEEHRPWAAHNFPNTTADQTLQGMMEELGELASADDHRDRADAVGDVLIYALHHANRIGVDLATVSEGAITEALRTAELVGSRTVCFNSGLMAAMAALGRLAHARLKRAQGIRKGEDHDATEVASLGRVVGAMELVSLALGETASHYLALTWDGIVKKRDWKVDDALGGDHDHRTTDYLASVAAARQEPFDQMVPADVAFGAPAVTAPKQTPWGASPTACTACGADLTQRGSVAYLVAPNIHHCEGCYNPEEG